MSLRATHYKATGHMSHAELKLSRQNVAHLETVPSFLGILYGEVLRRQVPGDSAAAMLKAVSSLAVKHTIIHAEHTNEFKILN